MPATTTLTRTPGMVRTALSVTGIEGTHPDLHRDLTRAYEDPESMFKEVTYGAGRQVIPRYSPEAFVQYVQLLQFLIDNQDNMEDEELHCLVVILGSAGILGSKHLSEIIGVCEGTIRRFISKPHKGAKPRMGGKFVAKALGLVKAGLLQLMRNGDADFVALKWAKEAGISITLLSRMTGISAQVLAKRFRSITNEDEGVFVDNPGTGVEADPGLEGHSTGSVEGALAYDENHVEGPQYGSIPGDEDHDQDVDPYRKLPDNYLKVADPADFEQQRLDYIAAGRVRAERAAAARNAKAAADREAQGSQQQT